MKKILLILALALVFGSCGDKDPGTTPPPPPKPPEAPLLPVNSLVFKSGVWAEHRVDSVIRFEKARGVSLDIVTVFPSDGTWEEMQNPWFLGPAQIPAGFKGTLNIGMGLWPRDGNLEDAAAGKYNAQWEKLGTTIAAKYPDAYIRPGMEMNIINMHWHATPATADKWKQAYRHAVNSLRKASSKFRIMWCIGLGDNNATGTSDASTYYPGDDYLDIIAVDVYDWWPPYTTVETIKRLKEAPYSWDWWLAFAKARNKKLALGEWGVVNLPTRPEGGGDNPKFINFVYDWLYKNKESIEMECYFHHSKDIGSDLFTTRNPKASAEYKAWMTKLKK